MASDEDLKLSDMLRYYMRDSQAAKDLLYRRLRALADYENANKALDKARTRNREVQTAESHQQLCCQRFERLSDLAKQGKPHSLEPPPLGCLPCQGLHSPPLLSRAHGLQVPPCFLFPQEPHRVGGAGAQTRQGEPPNLTETSCCLPPSPRPLGSHHRLSFRIRQPAAVPAEVQGHDLFLSNSKKPLINGSCYC